MFISGYAERALAKNIQQLVPVQKVVMPHDVVM